MTAKPTPAAALWLGGLGAIPFVGLAGAVAVADSPWRGLAGHALAFYGAVILSFLGGVHWGLAIGRQDRGDSRGFVGGLLVSVVPSLAGWAALLTPGAPRLLILAACFVAMLGVDLAATRAGYAPAWYPRLRIPLSLVVTAALVFGAWGMR